MSCKIEWQNGDECLFHDKLYYYVGPTPRREGSHTIVDFQGFYQMVRISQLSKPETPEQKAAREREEMAEKLFEIYRTAQEEFCDVEFGCSYWGDLRYFEREAFRAMVDQGVTVK